MVFLVFVSLCIYNNICVNTTCFGPIPWGHSGPLCHALSSSWTSIRRRRQQRHLVNGRAAAQSGEWAQHFSNASCLIKIVHKYGYTIELLQLSHLLEKADENLFKEIAQSHHCLHSLLHGLNYTDIVPHSQGTRFTLPHCKYELYKQSFMFINRCLFKDVYQMCWFLLFILCFCTFVTIISQLELMLCINLLLIVQSHVLFFIWWHLSTINKRLTQLLT